MKEEACFVLIQIIIHNFQKRIHNTPIFVYDARVVFQNSYYDNVLSYYLFGICRPNYRFGSKYN